MHKDVRELVVDLAKQGWRIELRKRGHILAFSPNRRTIVTLPGTPGDRRWKEIVLPKLREGGFKETK